MEGTALILAGGGGKGAYEIGVWRAMKELGIDKKIRAVSGASVGGLNGALFVQGDYDRARRIWLTMNAEKILDTSRFDFVEDLKAMAERWPDVEAESLLKDGIFSRDGLVQIIREELDVNRAGMERDSLLPGLLQCDFQLDGLHQRDGDEAE